MAFRRGKLVEYIKEAMHYDIITHRDGIYVRVNYGDNFQTIADKIQFFANTNLQTTLSIARKNVTYGIPMLSIRVVGNTTGRFI